MSDLDVRSRMADAAASAFDCPVDPTADLTRGLRARSRRRHRRLALAAVGGTAAVALGVAGLPNPGPTTSATDLEPAAFTLEQVDGEVVVHYNYSWEMNPERGEQLERDIETYGVAAEVDVNMDGRFCGNRPDYPGLPATQHSRDRAADREKLRRMSLRDAHAIAFRPADFSKSQTIVLNFVLDELPSGAVLGGSKFGVADSPVPTCQVE